MDKYTVVERPESSRKTRYPLDVIAATADNGHAIRIELTTPKDFTNARWSISQGMRKRGLVGHAKKDGDGLIAWADRPRTVTSAPDRVDGGATG